MTIRPGQCQQLLGAFHIVNGSTGFAYTLPNAAWGVLVACRAVITTTATVGNRTFIGRLLDSLGNILYEVASPNTQAASITQRYNFGAGMPAILGANVQTLPLPVEMPLPLNAQFMFLDSANVDANDNVTPTFIWAN